MTVQTIAGGYIAVICTRCRRDYHVFVLENPIISAYELEKLQTEALIALRDEEGFPKLEKLFRRRLEIYHIVGAWFEAQKRLYADERKERES